MKRALLGMALLSTVGLVQADESPNWNYAGLSYTQVDLDGETLNGFQIDGSALVSENVFIMGGYSNVGREYGTALGDMDLDLSSLAIGVGYRHPLSASTDVFGVASYQKSKIEASIEDVSSSDNAYGKGIELGVRSMLTTKFDLVASVGYAEMEGESDTAFSLQGTYHITEQFGVGLGFSKSEDVETVYLTGSFYF